MAPSEGGTTGATAEPPDSPAAAAPEDPSPKDRSALQAAQTFLSALERRETEVVFSLMPQSWQSTSGREFADRLGGTASVTVLSVELDRSRPVPANSVMIAASLDVVPEGDASPWSYGVATRFVLMTHDGAEWRAAGFGEALAPPKPGPA